MNKNTGFKYIYIYIYISFSPSFYLLCICTDYSHYFQSICIPRLCCMMFHNNMDSLPHHLFYILFPRNHLFHRQTWMLILGRSLHSHLTSFLFLCLFQILRTLFFRLLISNMMAQLKNWEKLHYWCSFHLNRIKFISKELRLIENYLICNRIQ